MLLRGQEDQALAGAQIFTQNEANSRELSRILANFGQFWLKNWRFFDQVRKGMLLVDPKVEPKASWTFSAEILILYHSTSVQLNYQPVVHIGTVRQVLNLDWNF